MSEKKQGQQTAIRFSSEKIRKAVNVTSLNPTQKLVLSEIASRVDWARDPGESVVSLTKGQIVCAIGGSIKERQVQNILSFLSDMGFIEIYTRKSFDSIQDGYKDCCNEFRLTPMLMLNYEKVCLERKLARTRSPEIHREVCQKVDGLKKAISILCENAMAQSERPERKRGKMAQEIKRLMNEKRRLEVVRDDAIASSEIDKAASALSSLQKLDKDIADCKNKFAPGEEELQATENKYFHSKKLLPPRQLVTPPTATDCSPQRNQLLYPEQQIAHLINTHQSENQSYDNSHSMKKSQKGLSEVLRRMAEMNLFGRYSQALKQPAETEKNQKSFGLTVLKCCGSKLADIDTVFQDLEEALKLVETSKALQDPPESGGYHSLGRLLFLQDLKKLDASSRLKYCQEARNFGGSFGMAYGAERMARAYNWDEAQTVNWLVNGNAVNVSKGDQGDEVSKHKSEAREDTDSTGVIEDSKTGEPSEALRASGNERDASGDTGAQDRYESDFQRRFRERREKADQGGFLVGEGIENRPLAEPCSEPESEADKPAKFKPTKALMQFNEQLQAGRLAPASTNVYESIQASGKEAGAGPDHAREPEEVQPDDVKKPAPESSKAGNQLRNSSRKGQYLESDSALNKVCGPENVAPEDGLFTHANRETETTPAGTTSQYDFNVPAAGLSAASEDPKSITTDSCLLSNQSDRNITKSLESELNLGGTGNSGGRNKPAADTSTASILLQEQLQCGLVFSESDLAAGIPESPAGSDIGGFEQVAFREKQRPEAPKESSRKSETGMVENSATNAFTLNFPQSPQNLKPDAQKSSGPEINFSEDLCQLNSTPTSALTKKSKPESATETGQKLIIDTFTCTHNSSAELQSNVPDQINQSLTTASPGFDETAQAVRQPTEASDSELVDENFNGLVAAREKTSAVRDCDGGGDNTTGQCDRPGKTGESVTAGCADPSEPRNGETVTDYVLRACRVVSGGDNALWLSLWMEVDSLETDAEKIDWAEQKLREKYSKEHDITQVA